MLRPLATDRAGVQAASRPVHTEVAMALPDAAPRTVSPAVGPSPDALPPDAEIPVRLRGYVLPDDSKEEPAHAGG
jgi:hypothetical protein